MSTLIDIIRHGEPEGGQRFRGNGCDDPLSAKGWEQMRHAVGEAAPWQRIISSPLRRCAAFARELAERHQLPLSIDERFKEVGFGVWEGQSPQQLIARDRQAYEAFYDDPVHQRPTGAEPLEAFSARIRAALVDTAATYGGQHLLLVAHAGVIRATVGDILAAPPERWYRISVDNAHFCRIRYDRRGALLEAHNSACIPL